MRTLAEALFAVGGFGSHSGGTKSPVALLLVGIVFIIVAGTQAINPRATWKMSRWAYKNPEANEPSDKAFAVTRVVGVVVAIVGVVLVITAITKF